MDLLDLVRQPEGKTLEFKREVASPEGLLRTVVAFANTAGGIVLVGVEDGTRRVSGVRDPLNLEERLANIISDSVEPRLVPDLEILPWRRTYVLAVRVYPSGGRPHWVKREGPERGVYVRTGSTNRRADADLIREMWRYGRAEAFDEQPMPAFDSDALDFRAASELFAPVRILKNGDFETLRLLTHHQGRLVPTVGGMLMFGKNRSRHFPDAWIQAGRFRGTDKAGIVDRAEIRLHLPSAIEAAVAFVERHSLRGAEIGAVRRKDRWTLPPAAVREAVVNAVAHADYSQRGAPIRVSIFEDRLEVENPGMLLFGLTVDDLRRGVSKLRNRVIGRVFHDIGFVEQWGSGIQRMIVACREAGLPAPTFEEIGCRFRVTLGADRRSEPVLNRTDDDILQCLADEKGWSTAELARAIGLTPRATRSRMVRLMGLGLVHEIGTAPQDPQRRYFRARQR